MRRFKLDRKGFTLIELLAVITILGILMLILIPSVSRIIENSRKNTFLSTAKNYANAVRDEWAADNLYCSGTGAGAPSNKLASSLNTGTFYIFIQSAPPASGANAVGQIDTTKYDIGTSSQEANTNFVQLINSGGRSSWGNNEVTGYVKVHVHPAGATSVTGDIQMAYDYYVELIDTASHGITDPSTNTKQVGDLIRSDVATTGASPTKPSQMKHSISNGSGGTTETDSGPMYHCIVS